MRVEVLHRRSGIELRIAQRIDHRQTRAVPVFRRRGDVMRIAAHAKADELGIDPRAARLGVLELFEHHGARRHRRARTRRDPGPTAGSRAAGTSLRVESALACPKPPTPVGVVAISARRRQHHDRHRRTGCVRTPRPMRVGRGRAGRDHAQVRAAQAVADRQVAGDHVDDGARARRRARSCADCRLVRRRMVLGLDSAQAADAGAR